MTVGQAISTTAVKALHDPSFTGVPGECQKFVREVCEAACTTSRIIMDEHAGASALATMENFRGSQWVIWERGSNKPLPTIQPGDIAYKGQDTSGLFGHTAIAGNGDSVGLPPSVLVFYENSSYHINPEHSGDVSGAKGFRTMFGFGLFDMLVRLH